MPVMAWVRTGRGGLLSCLLASVALAGEPRSPDKAATLARSLEAMAYRGEISPADLRHLKREAFLRWPEARGTAPPPVICQNEAVRAARSFARARGVPVLAYPPPYTDFIESRRFPIRVYHENAATMAQAVLVAAEDAWYHQVDVVGYPAPHTDGDEGPVIPGLWIYVTDAGGAAGYAEPLADISWTEECDCSVRVVMDRANSLSDVPIIVSHEFNHATQLATDCTEVISAFENFATAVMNRAYPDDSRPLPRIAEFQAYPEWPFDYWTGDYWDTPSNAYQYGAALFPLYLDARFGRADLTFIKDVWNSFAQNGTVTVNEWGWPTCSAGNHPDWFEGLENTLARHGATLDEAFDEFSYWRNVTGPYDDGMHFPDGDTYAGIAATAMSLASLPASLLRMVHEYGSTHVLLTNTAGSAPLEIRVDVDDGATFGTSLLLWKTRGNVERRIGVFNGSTAVFSVESFDEVTRAVVVVSQRSDGNYDPDDMYYSTVRSIDVSAVHPSVPPDAGTPDLWVAPDAPLPVGEGGADAATSSGQGLLRPAPRGCACQAGGAPTPPGWPSVLGIVPAVLLARRRGARPGRS